MFCLLITYEKLPKFSFLFSLYFMEFIFFSLNQHFNCITKSQFFKCIFWMLKKSAQVEPYLGEKLGVFLQNCRFLSYEFLKEKFFLSLSEKKK